MIAAAGVPVVARYAPSAQQAILPGRAHGLPAL